jgi:hypothetical protein
VIPLALLAAFTLTAAGLTNTLFTSHRVTVEMARCLSESATSLGLSRALYALDNQLKYGTTYLPNDTIDVQLPCMPAGSHGYFTFNQGLVENGSQVPWSINNFGGNGAVTDYDGKTLVANAFCGYGCAQCQGISSKLKSVIYAAPFPYAIASAGRISSNGGLVIAGQPNTASVVASAPLGPGDIATNSLGVAAMDLGSGSPSTITGDAVACGSIIPGSATILGATRPGADAVPLPRVDVTVFDPVAPADPKPVTAVPTSGGPISGICRAGSSLTLNGDLVLDDALVYVNGDLTVNGGIQGVGAVLVNGATTVTNGSSLDASNQICLVSKNDVSLGGSGAASSFFQGLVYTEGNFTAQDITIVGAFVANTPGSSSGPPTTTMTLNNMGVTHVPTMTALSMMITIPATAHTTETQPATSIKLMLGQPDPNNPNAAPSGSNYSGMIITLTGQAASGGNNNVTETRTNDPNVYGGQQFPNAPQEYTGTLTYPSNQNLTDGKQSVVSINYQGQSAPGAQVVGDTQYDMVYNETSGKWETMSQAVTDAANLSTQTSSSTTTTTTYTTSNTPKQLPFVFDLNKFIQPSATVRVLLWQER